MGNGKIVYGPVVGGGGSSKGGGGESSPSIFPGRVNRIILDVDSGINKLGDFSDENEKNLYMAYDALGMIFWDSIENPSLLPSSTTKDYAYPLFPNFKNYPLIDEIVSIIALPGKNINENRLDVDLYYFPPMNLYQNVHQNSNPNELIQSTTPISENKTIPESIITPNKQSEEEIELDLGKTFKDRPIRDLQMFEGDVALQGRWGNSIRFSSTIKDKKTGESKNDWSKNGETGDAITIIRNGQYEEDKDPWVPITENINKDKSSIYLTTNQQIPINISDNNKKYASFTSYTPTSPDLFTGEQVILNSGRLLFNSKSDHILMSSNKTISFNAEKGFNFDTPSNFVVKVGTKIMLGDKSSSKTEPSVLGQTLVDKLDRVLKILIQLVGIGGLQAPYMVSSVGSPAVNAILEVELVGMEEKLAVIKSELGNVLQNNVRIVKNSTLSNTEKVDENVQFQNKKGTDIKEKKPKTKQELDLEKRKKIVQTQFLK